MMLSDGSIYDYCQRYELITPFSLSQLQPSSYDLRLDNKFYDDNKGAFVRLFELTLMPNEFILASTIEKVKMPLDMVGRVEGKSSLGRIGLLTHITAGFIDAGFEGNITLELKNVGNKPIVLSSGCDIAQICFIQLDKECEHPYNTEHNHYQYQKDVTKSRYKCDGGVYYVY